MLDFVVEQDLEEIPEILHGISRWRRDGDKKEVSLVVVDLNTLSGKSLAVMPSFQPLPSDLPLQDIGVKKNILRACFTLSSL